MVDWAESIVAVGGPQRSSMYRRRTPMAWKLVDQQRCNVGKWRLACRLTAAAALPQPCSTAPPEPC